MGALVLAPSIREAGVVAAFGRFNTCSLNRRRYSIKARSALIVDPSNKEMCKKWWLDELVVNWKVCIAAVGRFSIGPHQLMLVI